MVILKKFYDQVVSACKEHKYELWTLLRRNIDIRSVLLSILQKAPRPSLKRSN